MKKAAVFLLFGQSNAVGHGIPMEKEDIISVPLKNVFGLHRKDNQFLDLQRLTWQGYESGGMNLAEEQDHTYSLANCLARQWQDRIDGGEDLPDLYIIQIAIGAQGVTDKYMWHPDREEKLIPGKLGTVDISLFPFACRILSLLDDSFRDMGKDYEIMGLHWRGGEEDTVEPREVLEQNLKEIYCRIFQRFNALLGNPPVVLHGIYCPARMDHFDPTGRSLENMYYINQVFEELTREYPNLSLFDVRTAPFYDPSTKENGIFKEDFVHYTPQANRWVAQCILEKYLEK